MPSAAQGAAPPQILVALLCSCGAAGSPACSTHTSFPENLQPSGRCSTGLSSAGLYLDQPQLGHAGGWAQRCQVISVTSSHRWNPAVRVGGLIVTGRMNPVVMGFLSAPGGSQGNNGSLVSCLISPLQHVPYACRPARASWCLPALPLGAVEVSAARSRAGTPLRDGGCGRGKRGPAWPACRSESNADNGPASPVVCVSIPLRTPLAPQRFSVLCTQRD